MEPLPAEIGKYRVECELGRGGMGVVYRAFDRVVEREVAIKTLGYVNASSPKPQEQLRQEARAVGQLEHPNIVSLYDAGELGGVFYLVMQLVHGETLYQRMGRRPAFSLQEILEIFQQLLEALAYAHSRGVVHRDIKPSNIMLTPEGVVKVTDFGVAKIADSRISSAGMVVGTPSYMSPEQILGGTIDARSDIFALGCILYELATRKKAFGGGDTTSIIYKIVHEAPATPSVIFPEIDPGLDAVILKALAKTPAQRFSSCTVFRRELEACIQSESTPSPAKLRGRKWNRPLVWLGLAGGVVATLLLSAQVIRSPRARPVVEVTAMQHSPPAAAPAPVQTVTAQPAPIRLPPAMPRLPKPVSISPETAPSAPLPAENPPPEPDTFAAVMLRGDVAFQRNRYAEALSDYKKAARIKPADRFVRRKIKVALTLLGGAGEERVRE